MFVRVIREDIRVKASELLRRGVDVGQKSLRRAVHEGVIGSICPGHREEGHDKRFRTIGQTQRICRGVPLVDAGRQRLEHKTEDDIGHIFDGRAGDIPLLIRGLDHRCGGYERRRKVYVPVFFFEASQS